jgi:hypothetical protein
MRTRSLVLIAAALAPVALVGDANARAARRIRPAKLSLLEAPLGLQGSAGAGINVAIPFRLTDHSFRRCDVEMQYGIDRDGDGVVSETEFRFATESRLDPRNTRRDRQPQLYSTSADLGASHAIVWRSDVDLGPVRVIPGKVPVLSPQGRVIGDPDDPQFPGPFYTNPGVVIRLRPVSVSGRRGPWSSTAGFAFSGNHAPSISFDSFASGSTVLATWSAYDADTEDFNGNGVLDVADGEDVNGNGILDTTRVGIAFDWHRLAPGEDPATMTDDQLASLQWLQCTRVAGVGDSDALVLTPGQPPVGDLVAGYPGVGHSYVFAWAAAQDTGGVGDRFLLRGSPIDEQGQRGSTVYSRTVVGNSD